MPINSGDTVWILVSSALVMLMMPGVALFYGGMVGRKNVLYRWYTDRSNRRNPLLSCYDLEE